MHEFLHFLPHVHELLRESNLQRLLLSNFFMKLLDFEQVFFFELFKRKVSRGFVIAHVIIPGGGEFEELRSLR